jgi:hypothetical protein
MDDRYSIKNATDVQTYIYFKPESSLFDPIKGNRNKYWLKLEGDTNFKVYPDSNDVDGDDGTTLQNLYETSYKNIAEYIYRLTKNSQTLCKNLPDYVGLKSFYSADAIVIVGSKNNILPNGNIFGFALININGPQQRPPNSINIYVICSHTGIQGAGHILINAIEYIGRNLSMSQIDLSSVAEAYSFYTKYGFVKTSKDINTSTDIKKIPCANGCTMRKYLNTSGGRKTKTRKTKTRKTKTRKRKPARRK